MVETAQAITHRRVLKIAVPVVAANVTVPILGAVDTGVVGQLGEAAPIGAVGIGAIILTAIYWVFGFLRMGTAGLASQALGAGDRRELAAILTRVLMIGFAGGAAVILLQIPLFWASFQIAPASDQVEALARDYMGIRVWSAPAMIALYGVMGWLIAQERTASVLVVQLTMNGINIVFDLLFVLGFDWGVQGVAVATLISEWSGLALGLWLCRAAFRVPDWRDWARVLDRARLVRMARVNTDILIRSLLLEVMIVSFMFMGARFGDVALAANQVLLQFLHVTAYAMDGFAFGAEALVGQALGARNRAALRRAAVVSSIWGAVIVVLLAGVFLVAGGVAIDIMATDEGVRQAARDYLPWMVLAPIIGWLPWMMDGIFIGATRTADMRNMMVVSLAVYGLAAVLLVPAFGNHGLWAAYIISYAARGVTLAARYPALERSAG
ncbi:MATE family multidrug resistance protein [Maritimibacter alkaliphilus HTCC2654]|uniref:DNA-damage-inducible protein F n=1 Tax=Maritimibacter alkaliphilus HTCC2654 TaxID=314271 RepID=A3VAS7_9RHOB|nr:MATE family efflux transporter [Maritimibacter alkaliphilus]EAQ15018.1 DNA-damage-inducible protein F [Maritimibacter alkaliphilus HTCC2654]TYP80757.1 MATE family multidrug resistance protein [Maritimibacter alkaliphilus HTCC2654]